MRICRIDSGYLNQYSSPNALNEFKRLRRKRRIKLSPLREKRLIKISALGEYGELHKLEALSANFRPKKKVDSNLLPGGHGMVKKPSLYFLFKL
jgi:hypothetical protein